MARVALIAAAAVLALLLAASAQEVSIGDALFRDYSSFRGLPITASDALSNGWFNVSTYGCQPNLGFAFAQSQDGPTEDNPLTLFFGANGNITGMGATYYGTPPSSLVPLFWQPITTGQYFMSISFRDGADVCDSGSYSQLPLGDRLVINADSATPTNLPVLESDAQQQGWVKGACFHTMGTHYAYDLASAPNMSWEAANLLPVVLMMNNGQINAVFFASSTVQQGFTSAHYWDSLPLPDILMCKNWCDSACTWHDTNFWSTMHMFFNADYDNVVCPGGCTLSCCPGV